MFTFSYLRGLTTQQPVGQVRFVSRSSTVRITVKYGSYHGASTVRIRARIYACRKPQNQCAFSRWI